MFVLPIEIPGMPFLRDIASTSFWNVFLTDSGDLYGCGLARYGQLGPNMGFEVSTLTNLGISNVDSVTATWGRLTPFNADCDVVGYEHTMFLSGGTVYGMGYGRYGQLGQNDTVQSDPYHTNTTGPIDIGLPEPISALYSVGWFYLARSVSTPYRWYGWGIKDFEGSGACPNVDSACGPQPTTTVTFCQVWERKPRLTNLDRN